MDSYHGNKGQRGPAFADISGHETGSGGALAGEDDVDREPPPASVGQNERRMQVRAYNYWASLLGDQPCPPIEELISAALPEFADHAVVLDFAQGLIDPAVTMLGARLAEECGTITSITRLSEVHDRSLLARITDHYRQILANAAPIGFEAEFVNQRGRTLLYRGILLPFASDDGKIRHVMAVINWKEVADPSVIAALKGELEVAGGAGHSPLSPPQLHAWADGPVTEDSDELAFAPPLPIEPGDWTTPTTTMRELPERPLADISANGSEFALLLIRRLPGGRLCYLGEVCRDAELIERAARHLL